MLRLYVEVFHRPQGFVIQSCDSAQSFDGLHPRFLWRIFGFVELVSFSNLTYVRVPKEAVDWDKETVIRNKEAFGWTIIVRRRGRAPQFLFA
jgi:hypothetical protein